MKTYGRVLLITGFLLLAGCQSSAKPSQTAYVPDDDMCGASDYQQYLGKPLSSVNNLRFDNPVRAIGYHSVVAMDFNLRRLNFFADSQGMISRVYCG
ncbi:MULTISPECIES: I78 family peptidase inhibitor [Tatumella]|uniref:I78 family peptidase inhibitor n=1 Tax=Tatumella punctata TaxID=399969 RepID=A0ABW1VQA8_9GAMM|nr:MULTISPECIES: I78 family peptidase inhibitor [unclassified Tatumella]MBS0856824.1 peptidase inhibitor I78 family protein [Tatumella sp. JGM16]MBS0878787.1 peptidase inhibitor I78 family protein [Tatumella sp. JGM82]MBS0890116.1 peptidase inhibitor I78 family protein [Tatumella sp. JGM94]MBS0893696.1 peptidase inhibitor I78 family protein [Tatumella sp. JGM130]MBS0901951.1 peptidase inhibitor I78 family protein [Tatumella sp. JGM100]